MTKLDSPARLAPRSHWFTTARDSSASSPSWMSPCQEARSREAYSSLSPALPCVSATLASSPSAWSSQRIVRVNIGLAVAIVGRPRKTPPCPKREARTSDASSAPSVLPTPMGASTMRSGAERAACEASTRARWMPRAGHCASWGKRWCSRVVASVVPGPDAQGRGRASKSVACSSRVAVSRAPS